MTYHRPRAYLPTIFSFSCSWEKSRIPLASDLEGTEPLQRANLSRYKVVAAFKEDGDCGVYLGTAGPRHSSYQLGIYELIYVSIKALEGTMNSPCIDLEACLDEKTRPELT